MDLRAGHRARRDDRRARLAARRRRDRAPGADPRRQPPAFNAFAPGPGRWAALGIPVDLIVGEDNQGREPYGTSFAAIARLLPQARTHVLAGQGHLAHVEAAGQLSRRVSTMITAARGA
ncbi:pimeloyl-ACP methyl ester carboxylesterase [Catenuloplanes nepalensis]|uniref:Pimeloyl-ACP methyl ester carboxylesterase n=1 Tax=Catenuloplanes nepalensis TaxID=587533 RepID=A0ABT9MTM3_9ACTN|nr:hypothetical protein [Catenuloplanes nepalensis]MDP9794787.1 pimeloyl-ACP methyl ester carboxylesterase [Catenuloplanes nepalensis]